MTRDVFYSRGVLFFSRHYDVVVEVSCAYFLCITARRFPS